MRINLNADLGESFGPWPMGDDHRLLAVVNSANVACGFHAGDPLVMQRTLADAHAQGVSIGAHPGFPDLQGFGRRQMQLPADEVAAAVLYQLAAIDGVSRAHGARMTHVKPHGAMNNMACEQADLAQTIANACRQFRADVILLAPAGSELARAGHAAGLAVALEVFADRAYTTAGHLVPRNQPGAVLDTSQACIDHVLAMIEARGIVAVDGTVIPTQFHSICVHGDNAHAVDTAIALRQALLSEGHTLATLPELMADESV